MSSAEAKQEIACPDCGAPLPEVARYCWLCGFVLTPTAQGKPAVPVPAPRRAAVQFSLASLMFAMTFVAVLVGVFTLSPGIGLALLFLTAPALVRTCVIMVRRRRRGESVSMAAKVGVFAASLGIVVAVVAASIAAFFVVCLAVFDQF